MKNQDMHLNEDQIIRAAVDEKDLTTSEQSHLSQCLVCQKDKQELAQVLHRVGDMAQELVPSPRRKLIVDSQKIRSSFRWQPALVTGFAIVLLLVGIWQSSLLKRFQENELVHIVQKMESDEQFPAEIPFTEYDALPDQYLYIIGVYNGDDYDDYDDYDDDYYDEQFFEFVLPL